MADFYHRRNHDEAAREEYEKGADCLIKITPAPLTEETAAQLADRLTRLAETVCRMSLKEWPDTGARDARSKVDTAFFDMRTWLTRFELQHNEKLKELLRPRLDHLWENLQKERDAWFDH